MSFCICFLLLQPAISLAAVIINEIAWMGTTNSSNDEWIELFNNSETEINLNGWLLKSSDEKLKINLKGNIPSQGFFLLERTDDQTVPNIKADLIYKGSLSNNGEALILTDNNGAIVDQADFQDGWLSGDNKTKQTMERTSSVRSVSDTGLTLWQSSQNVGGTPKETNSQGIINNQKLITNDQLVMSEALPTTSTSTSASSVSSSASASTSEITEAASLQITATTNSSQKQIVYPKNIFINEILPAPEGPDDKNEWVEIFNANDFAVNLAGWQIKDVVGATKTYTLPNNSQIPANGFLLIPRTDSKITLQNNGDGLGLFNPKSEMVDQVAYSSAPNNQSYSHSPNGWVWGSILTPGAVNKASENYKQTSPIITEQTATAASQAAMSNNIASAAAQINNFAPRTSHLLTFVLGLIIALISAIIVFFLRKKSKN